MKSLVLLLCLAQLCGCHSVPHGPILGYREPACDDPETEQAALAAVDYINKHLPHGYKHILNQIESVKVWPRRPTGEVFDLEIDTLETTCHVLDPTPLANCSVRQLKEHAVEGDCDFNVLKQDGQFSVLSAKCDSSPDSAEDVHKVCPDCPLLAPLNDSRVVHAVEAALAAFNAQKNGSYFQLVEISRAQFVQYGFCKGTVTEKVAGGEDVAVTCTVFQTQPVLPQPQPDGTEAGPLTPAQGSAGPALSPAGLPAASLVVGPRAVAAPPIPPPVHPAHYDLRHVFSGVASVESASGEAFHVGKTPKVAQPSVPAPEGPVPVVRPCPGRIRYFKI
ncbi:alpha-2-HS-glycoprotein isoform X1 [Eubalaena glacialis]|uniref:alpha-2-HS-glycoprotein isoform X1 n=1 Tax=Eubalaena glacialis TaxID=27606 RepID=UPI002A5A994C|nr:alpha-2-HS-glycoprotein isoform X1 [Eubalaena glacialis]